MRNITKILAVAALACALALGVGCSAPASSSAASAGQPSSPASASSAPSDSASAASSSAPSDSASAASAGQIADGSYTIEVTLEGGSGRASVESPAALTVADGAMTATLVWSSPNYDQMVVDGVQYLPVNESGNSTFEVPVPALDADLAVQAETTAMSEPHMIDYTLHFDSSTLQ